MSLNATQMVNYIFSSLDEAQQRKGCFGLTDCRTILNSANLLLKYIEIGNSDDNKLLNIESHTKTVEARSVLIESCNVIQNKGGFPIVESVKLLSYLEILEKELLKIKTQSSLLLTQKPPKTPETQNIPIIEVTDNGNLESKISNLNLEKK